MLKNDYNLFVGQKYKQTPLFEVWADFFSFDRIFGSFWPTSFNGPGNTGSL